MEKKTNDIELSLWPRHWEGIYGVFFIYTEISNQEASASFVGLLLVNKQSCYYEN